VGWYKFALALKYLTILEDITSVYVLVVLFLLDSITFVQTNEKEGAHICIVEINVQAH
jgi:hypothetical protein